MSENYLHTLIKDPDNLKSQMTLKEYIDIYTKQNYSVVNCIDYLLEQGQITQINIELINELCSIYEECDKNQLKMYYTEYLQYEINISESETESDYIESNYIKSDTSSTIIIDTMDDSSQSENINSDNLLIQQLNEKEKLKNDIKQILGKSHKEKMGDINEQIDILFDNVLEKENNSNHANDYKYVIKNNEEQIKSILDSIVFTCRLSGKQVKEDKILEIKQLVFKTIINKCVNMYNVKNIKFLNITKIEKIKHFKDLVKLGSSLGILEDKNRELGSELKDFCKASYLNERLKINGDDIVVKINNNTYEISKDNTNIEIKKSNKKDVFTKINETNNASKIRVKVNEIDILSRVIDAIDEINNPRRIGSAYQSINE